MGNLEWVMVPGIGGRAIGAVGFIGDHAAVVVAFHDDLDGNMDGEVDWVEWIAGRISPVHLDGKAVTEVAMAARFVPGIVTRDGEFDSWAKEAFVGFAGGLVIDGLYAAWFSLGVRAIAGGIASAIGGGIVREYVIRKSMESAVHRLYDMGVRDGRVVMPQR
jgi:hypothetical protein